MPNLDEKQKNRMMAAADIVEHGDLAVLQKILEFQDFLEEKYQIDKENISTVLSRVEEMKAYCDSCVSGMNGDMSKHMQDMGYMMNDLELKLKEQINQSDKTTLEQIKDLSQRLTGEINAIKSSIPTMPDLSVLEAKIGEIKASIPIIKDTILDNPIQIRDKLESIEPEEEKLPIEAIRDLRKELDEIIRKISKAKGFTMFGGGGSSGGGRTVQVYDLSGSLNGVLKAFSLPAFWKIISIHSSSFPYIFRPTVDFTVSGSTITFTDEIQAATTLNTGQTLLVLLAE